MLLMSVAYNFFTATTPTILLLVYLPLNSITNTKTVMWNVMINNLVQMANYKLNSKDKII